MNPEDLQQKTDLNGDIIANPYKPSKDNKIKKLHLLDRVFTASRSYISCK